MRIGFRDLRSDDLAQQPHCLARRVRRHWHGLGPVERKAGVVEDILDTGLTLKYLLRFFEEKKPKHLRVVVLLDKVERRIADVRADYTGFVIPNKFVVGYGLDFDERYRNLPDVCTLQFASRGKEKSA